jgi:hypothetical protein
MKKFNMSYSCRKTTQLRWWVEPEGLKKTLSNLGLGGQSNGRN